MKNKQFQLIKRFSTALAIATLPFTPLAIAEENPWNISLLGSYLNPDEDRGDLDDDFGFGGAVGYRFSQDWEGRFMLNNWKFTDDVRGYGLDALYHINDQHLYGILGYKHLNFAGGDDGNDILNLGLGKRFSMDDNLYFTAEALVGQSFDDSLNDMMVNLGVTYLFGSKPKSHPVKPAPQPAPVVKAQPKDSDGDGVYDDQDACPNTPSIDAVDSKGCSKYTLSEDNIRLSINFANNSDRVDRQYYSEIKRVADFMNKYPDSTVTIEGHTSAVGGNVYNQQLSEQRAKMVAKILTDEYGISQQRVRHIGYGEERLLNDANTREAHQQNRRIEARITGSKRVKVRR